jgi:hypothetical protein
LFGRAIGSTGKTPQDWVSNRECIAYPHDANFLLSAGAAMTPRPLVRAVLFLAVVVGAGGMLMVGQAAKPTATRMADASSKLLGSLNADQKKKASFAYNDPHRTTWYFTPQQDKEKKSTRKGLPLEEMTADQKASVLELLKVGLSAKGYEQATTIIGLESLLAELEGKTGAMVRNPNWYFVSIFGEPSNTGQWGWRLEGHHLSVNFTLDKGQVVSATPLLFGVNPAEIKQGPRKGQRTLPEIEDLAKALIKSLTPEQIKLAKQAKQLPEIKEKQSNADVGPMIGIPAEKLTADQQKTLTKLVEAYANRLPGDLSEVEMKRYTDAGPGKVTFAYALEEDKPGQPYTYRVHGPTFVVEFLNIQADSAKNPANHIHSGWRSLPNDFALSK